MAREDGEIDRAFEIVEGLLASLGVGFPDALAEEYHCASWATERFVGSGRDDIAIRERRVVDTSSDETGDVCHIHHEVAANFVCNLAHTLVVDFTAVSGCTGDENFGAVHEGILLELVVVNEAGLEIAAIWECLEVGRYCRDPSFHS